MRSIGVAVLLAAAASFSAAAGTGSAIAPDKEQRINDLFRVVGGGKSPGAAVAVISNGKILFTAGYGMADVEKAVSNTPQTIFRLASVTKSFTAMAVLQLVEAGKLNLDDPVARYVPDVPNARNIRISHLLTHTAGIPDFIPYEEVKKRGVEFEAGTRINYSNNGYSILGRVIEKVSGQPWDEYLRDHIFKPAGMKHTGYDRTAELPGRAAGYLAAKDGAYTAIAVQDAAGAYAGGGLYSTVEDMALWNIAVCSGKLLPRTVLERAWTPGTLNDGRRTSYGYGWMTSTYRGLREVGHGGDITGYNTYVLLYPDEKFSVIVLSNTGMRPPGPLPPAGDLAHTISEIWLSDKMHAPEALPSVVVPAATLDRYAGRYKLEAPEPVIQAMGTHIVITRDGDHLVAEAGGMKAPLNAASQTMFQATGSPAQITFVPDGTAKCGKLVITLMGLREFVAVRAE